MKNYIIYFCIVAFIISLLLILSKEKTPERKLGGVEIEAVDATAEVLKENGVTPDKFNPKYSRQDFTGMNLSEQKDLNNLVIYNTSFSQETPDSHIFPEDMTGTVFYNCNLDNVFVPEGNTIIGGRHNTIKVQNDGEDWILDADMKPVEPVNKEVFIQKGLSTDPDDIPKKKMSEAITTKPQ